MNILRIHRLTVQKKSSPIVSTPGVMVFLLYAVNLLAPSIYFQFELVDLPTVANDKSNFCMKIFDDKLRI